MSKEINTTLLQLKNDIEEYVSSLTEQERIVYIIAKEHLESSFDIEKSIGFLEWLDNKNKTKQK